MLTQTTTWFTEYRLMFTSWMRAQFDFWGARFGCGMEFPSGAQEAPLKILDQMDFSVLSTKDSGLLMPSSAQNSFGHYIGDWRLPSYTQ